MILRSFLAVILIFNSLVLSEVPLSGTGDSFINNFLPMPWGSHFEYTKSRMLESGYKSLYSRSKIELECYYDITVPSGTLSYSSIKINIFGLGEIEADLNINFWEDSLVGFSLSNISSCRKNLYRYFKYKYGYPFESINLLGGVVSYSWCSGDYKAILKVSPNKQEELNCFIDLKETVYFHEKSKVIKDRIDFIFKQNKYFFDVDGWFRFNKDSSYLVHATKDTVNDTTVYMEEPLVYLNDNVLFFIVRVLVATKGKEELQVYHYNMGKGPTDKVNHNIRRIVLDRRDFQSDIMDHWVHKILRPVPDLSYIEKTPTGYSGWLYDYPPEHYLRIVSSTVLDIVKDRK
jgi:hypothetical protein